MNAELVKQHPFLDERTVGTYAYYRVPKLMLTLGKTLGISTDETLLYSVLRDRVGLSLENGKADSEGRIYIYYSREKAANCLGWSKRKTVDVFKRLAGSGLLYEEDERSRRGKMLGRRLYVKLWQDVGIDFSLEDIQNMNFKFATAKTLEETSIGSYYRLPVVLVEDDRYKGLNLRSILLYMVILDRIALSKRYGRVDQNGLLWTTIDSDITGPELGCSSRSLSRSFKELEEIGLIERRSVEYAEKWRIYARDFSPPPVDPSAVPSPTPSRAPEGIRPDDGIDSYNICMNSDARIAPLSRQYCTPDTTDLHGRDAKSAPLCRQYCIPYLPNLHPNQISSIQTSFNQSSYKNNLPAPPSAAPEVRDLFSEEIAEIVFRSYSMVHYDDVLGIIYTKLDDSLTDAGIDLLDRCHDLIRADMLSCRANILFGNRSIPKERVLQAYSSLSAYTIFLLIEKIIPRLGDIKNLDAYLHWGLFTAAEHLAGESFFLMQDVGT